MTTTTVEQVRAAQVPAGALKITAKNSDAVVYVYTNAAGHPCAMGFAGRRTKPDFRIRYMSAAGREKAVTTYFASAAGIAARKAEVKAKAKTSIGMRSSASPRRRSRSARSRATSPMMVATVASACRWLASSLGKPCCAGSTSGVRFGSTVRVRLRCGKAAPSTGPAITNGPVSIFPRPLWMTAGEAVRQSIIFNRSERI
jgi:hypothetical protein